MESHSGEVFATLCPLLLVLSLGPVRLEITLLTQTELLRCDLSCSCWPDGGKWPVHLLHSPSHSFLVIDLSFCAEKAELNCSFHEVCVCVLSCLALTLSPPAPFISCPCPQPLGPLLCTVLASGIWQLALEKMHWAIPLGLIPSDHWTCPHWYLFSHPLSVQVESSLGVTASPCSSATSLSRQGHCCRAGS